MTRQKTLRTLFLSVSIIFLLVSPQAAPGQTSQLRIDYTVEVTSTNDQLFHITANIKNIRQARLELSLPVWTPGWYTIENYAKNILRFHITDAKGNRLPHRMIRKQTWRVETSLLSSIKVEFDYRASLLALNQAKITADYAFFTGTQLFLQAEGHRNSPSTVRLVAPQGWKVISALKETSDPNTFSASDYDTLIDSPTEMGKFDVTRFEVEGKPHYLVTTPAGAFSKENAEKYTGLLTKVFKTEGAIFGGLPYEKYITFYFFSPPETNAGGALEHANSFVAFARPAPFNTPENLIDTAAHEFFHTWNVKRIRPAEMWPYDYSRENESPLLWASEGLTNYYTDLSLYRAGVQSLDQFISSVEGAINGVENNPARAYISPADASTSTWLGYDTPVAFGISYYTQGQNLGALLDLSIINDMRGAAGLDDVMRALYSEFYKRGRGFTTEDMIAIINRLTRRDYHDFFRRYIWGVEVPAYDKVLGYAGYKPEKTTATSPVLGFDVQFVAGSGYRIQRIESNSPATQAGLLVGDVIVKIDGLDPRRALRAEPKPGQVVKMTINRDGEEKSIDFTFGSRDQSRYKIIELANPTPAQLKVREAWLRK
jgi:predicted metalloprotease with PDZ domain